MVTVPAFEWENLKREEVLRTLEARLTDRFHRRFWVLLIVAVVLSLVGVQTIAYLLIADRLTATARYAAPAAAYSERDRSFPERDAVAERAQAAIKRAEEQTARANNQMAGLADKIERLNAKVASLETTNSDMRLQLEQSNLRTASLETANAELRVRLERAGQAKPAPPELTAPKEEPKVASLPPAAPTPKSSSWSLPRAEDTTPYRGDSKYEVRIVVVGKTKAEAIPALASYFKRSGYKVVADPEPDRTSTHPTRQDFVFISYRRGAKDEAEKVQRALKREFKMQTVLARSDVGDKLAGDIQIAFQESH
jgi:hypothetical protein